MRAAITKTAVLHHYVKACMVFSSVAMATISFPFFWQQMGLLDRGNTELIHYNHHGNNTEFTSIVLFNSSKYSDICLRVTSCLCMWVSVYTDSKHHHTCLLVLCTGIGIKRATGEELREKGKEGETTEGRKGVCCCHYSYNRTTVLHHM